MIYRVIIMKKYAKFIYTVSLLWLAVYCITDSISVKETVSQALDRCIATVIPSLYAMMIISSLITESGMLHRLPHFITRAGRFITGREDIFPVFVFSMLAGYPVGAKLLYSQYRSGIITKNEAEIYCGICFGAGPAFIYGCISSGLYGLNEAGTVILISTLSADIILAAAVPLFIKRQRNNYNGFTPPSNGKFSLCGCVASGGRSMLGICSMILAFSVFTAFLGSTGIITAAAKALRLKEDTAEALVCSVLDVTAVDMLPHGDYTLLPLISGLVSFGGICVILQISALTEGRLSLLPMIILRLFASVISALICNIIMPYMLSESAVSVADIHISAHRSDSPLPSLILILMTFIVFHENEKTADLRQHRIKTA